MLGLAPSSSYRPHGGMAPNHALHLTLVLVAVVKPPRMLAVNVLSGSCGKSNSAFRQRDRSSLSRAAASMRRPAVTSNWDWVKAA